MISFAGTHLLPTPSVYKPTRISHCRTPSLSSISSTNISSTEDEAQTDALSCTETQDASILITSDLRESSPESENEIRYEPKTPRPHMTPTTPTDRFTRLNVSSRIAKGAGFAHRRLKSVGGLKREAGRHGGGSDLPEVDVLLDGKNTTRPIAISSPHPSAAKTDVNRATAPFTAIHKTTRFRPYTLQTRPSPHQTPRLGSDSLPPSLRTKIQADQPGKQWLLVGPEVARHLQMGGSVLVRDYGGNAVGWMS